MNNTIGNKMRQLKQGDSATGEERHMSNPEVTGSNPSQSLNSVGNQDLDLCRSNSAQCDISNGTNCMVLDEYMGALCL